MRKKRTVQERVAAYAVRVGDCLVWYGALARNGRPYIVVNGKDRSAYRALWEEVIGEIPDKLTIDHLCFNKACLNLEHMELVTHSENSLRGNREFRRKNPLFTCGHPRDGETAEWCYRKNGKRQLRCRPCYLKLLKEHNERRKHATANRIH